MNRHTPGHDPDTTGVCAVGNPAAQYQNGPQSSRPSVLLDVSGYMHRKAKGVASGHSLLVQVIASCAAETAEIAAHHAVSSIQQHWPLSHPAVATLINRWIEAQRQPDSHDCCSATFS